MGWWDSEFVEGLLKSYCLFSKDPKDSGKGVMPPHPLLFFPSPSSYSLRRCFPGIMWLPYLEPFPALHFQDTVLAPKCGNGDFTLWAKPNSPAASPTSLHCRRMSAHICNPQERQPPFPALLSACHPGPPSDLADLAAQGQHHLLPQTHRHTQPRYSSGLHLTSTINRVCTIKIIYLSNGVDLQPTGHTESLGLVGSV